MNLAAQAGVRYSIEKPNEYFKSNFLGFLILLSCQGHKILKRFFTHHQVQCMVRRKIFL